MRDKILILKEKISKGELKSVLMMYLQECSTDLFAQKYEPVIRLNLSRLSNIQNDLIKGTITIDFHASLLNQITESTLQILQNLEEDYQINNSKNTNIQDVIEFIQNNLWQLSLEGKFSEYESHPQRSDHTRVEKILKAGFNTQGDFLIDIDFEYIGKTIKKNFFLWYDADFEFHFEAHEIYSGNFKDISSVEIISNNHRCDEIKGCMALRFSCHNGRDLVDVIKGSIQYSVINGNPDPKSAKGPTEEKLKIPYFEILFMESNPYGLRLRNSFNYLLNYFESKKDIF